MGSGIVVITKTKFINYIRCPRYVALEEVKEQALEADVSLEDYLTEEKAVKINEIYNSMFDGQGESLVDIKDANLEVMLDYYQKIEVLSYEQVTNQFSNSIDLIAQEPFDYVKDGLKYLCYVDLCRFTDTAFDIIEVKATTSNKFLKLGPKVKGEMVSLFDKDKQGIFRLKEEISNYQIEKEMPLTKYYYHRQKLIDKYHDSGHYIYDLLIQRLIIEGYLKENKQTTKINKINYYLAVLNSDYIFDGTYNKNGDPIYKTDINGNELILLFDFTKLTKEMLPLIEHDRKQITSFLKKMNIEPCPLGIHCQHKKSYKCKFLEVCFYQRIPKINSLFAYFDNHYGFKDKSGLKTSTFDLINQGIINMLDLREEMLTRANNIIQRRVVEKNEPYINKDKIKSGLKNLVYPLYYLDFETFPCPLPRYFGEKCYDQSVFQYSLHIESKPGVINQDQDHYSFLATSHQDEREALVKSLCNHLRITSGTVIVYNQTFEKSRLKELASLFPHYRQQLLKIREHTFDLLDLIKNKTSLYRDLGYNEQESLEVNYYHPLLNGSYSIKRVLPIFAPHLDYQSLAITDGSEAFLTYAKFKTFKLSELKQQQLNLLNYCKQDTWAMVIILNKLKELVK